MEPSLASGHGAGYGCSLEGWKPTPLPGIKVPQDHSSLSAVELRMCWLGVAFWDSYGRESEVHAYAAKRTKPAGPRIRTPGLDRTFARILAKGVTPFRAEVS
jgi:hypothetical protein